MGSPTSRRRSVPYHCLSPSEIILDVPGIRRRILTFATNDALSRAIRVSWEWFDDAVAVLYNTMEVRVALGMGTKMNSPRFIEYNSVVRQVTQHITANRTTENGQLVETLEKREGDEEYPFLPTDVTTIGAAAEAAPLLFPSVHSVVSDLPPGYVWGEGDMRRGGDRSFLSFTEDSGYDAETLYVERCIGISTDDHPPQSEIFKIPSIPEFETSLAYVILARDTHDPKNHLKPIIPFESLISISRIKEPVKVFATLGIDVNIRTIIKLFQTPMPPEWPFSPLPTIDCDRVVGLGLKEFRALAAAPGIKGVEGMRLDTPSPPDKGSYLRPSDIHTLRDILKDELPNLKDLSISIVVTESSELDYTDDLLDYLPPGSLQCLIVRLWSHGKASSSQTTRTSLTFPFNLIRRLATCVVEGGSLILHGQDSPEAGTDLSAVITWIRDRPPRVRRMISRMNYAELGVGCTNDLSRICYDYGTPMTLGHSLTYFFTSDLLGQIDRHLRNPTLAPNHPTKTPTTTLSLLSSRAQAFDLNHQVMDAHWKGVKLEKDTLAARAAKILWECKTAGMTECASLMTTKYPTFFDGLRKAAQNAAADQAKRNGAAKR